MNITIDTTNNGALSSSSSASGATNINTTTNSVVTNGNTTNLINHSLDGINNNAATSTTNNINNTVNLNAVLSLPNPTSGLSAHNLDENVQLINDLKQIQLENSNILDRPVVLSQTQPGQNVNVQQMQQQQQQQSPILAYGINNLNAINTSKESSRFRIIKTDSDRKVSSPLDPNAESLINNGIINGMNGVLSEMSSMSGYGINGNGISSGLNMNLMNGNGNYINGVISNSSTQIGNNIDPNHHLHHQMQLAAQIVQQQHVHSYTKGRWYVSDIDLASDQQQIIPQSHQSFSINNHQSPIIISTDLNDPVYNNSSSNNNDNNNIQAVVNQLPLSQAQTHFNPIDTTFNINQVNYQNTNPIIQPKPATLTSNLTTPTLTNNSNSNPSLSQSNLPLTPITTSIPSSSTNNIPQSIQNQQPQLANVTNNNNNNNSNLASVSANLSNLINDFAQQQQQQQKVPNNTISLVPSSNNLQNPIISSIPPGQTQQQQGATGPIQQLIQQLQTDTLNLAQQQTGNTGSIQPNQQVNHLQQLQTTPQTQSQQQQQSQLPPLLQQTYDILNVDVNTTNLNPSNQLSPQQKDQQIPNTVSGTNVNMGLNQPIPVNSTNSASGTSVVPSLQASSVLTTSISTISNSNLDHVTGSSFKDLNVMVDDIVSEPKSTGDSGIHSRIELAMDLVKSHLTLAVKEEIVALKNQIKQLNESCARLEQENQILRQHATPEGLKLIESIRGATGNQGYLNAVSSISNISTNSLNSSTQQSNIDSSNMPSVQINNNNSNTNTTAANNSANNNSSLTESQNTLPNKDHSQESMISSFTEQVINNGDILSNLQPKTIDQQ